jgi:mannose-6-phosphate isomerase-like protein (cupin superfamily)
MALKPNKEVGAEPCKLDQFFNVEDGTGEAIIDSVRTAISTGFAVHIPARTMHNMINTSNTIEALCALRATQSSRRRRT